MKLYYHTAPWCAPCKQVKPKVKDWARTYGVEFIEVDVDKDGPMLPEILGLPTVVLVREGAKPLIFGPTGISDRALTEALP